MIGRLKDYFAERGIAFLDWAIERRAKYYAKCFSPCYVACSIEIWSKVTGRRPVDFESSTYAKIKQVCDCYLYRSFRVRSATTLFERTILKYQFSYARVYAPGSAADAKRIFDFVLQHRLARLLKRYENSINYIASQAAREVTSAEASTKMEISASHWTALVKQEQLPSYLNPKWGRIFLRTRLRFANSRVKRELARANYEKLDFTASDLSSLVALSGSLLLLLGYMRIALMSWYFGIPYERYFSIADYLASSIGSTQRYLAYSILSIAFWWFALFAQINAYSVQEQTWRQQSLSERLADWNIRFAVGICLIAAVWLYINEDRFEYDLIYAPVIYFTFMGIAHLSRTYFENPAKTYFYSALIVMPLLGGLAGVNNEIKSITSFDTRASGRVLKFDNGVEYAEPAWRVFAITSGFVILRRQLDGIVHVHSKSDLKSIIDIRQTSSK